MRLGECFKSLRKTPNSFAAHRHELTEAGFDITTRYRSGYYPREGADEATVAANVVTPDADDAAASASEAEGTGTGGGDSEAAARRAKQVRTAPAAGVGLPPI